MNAIRFEKDDQGVVVLTLDMPGRSANVLGRELIGPLEDTVATLADDSTLTGVVITSAKKDFIAGADLEQMFAGDDIAETMDLLERFKAALRKLESLGKPVVAAMNGSALGGGYEVALACHHRLLLNDKRVKVGLPEAKLGLLPGGGGTQRLSRLLGFQASLPLMIEGKELRPEEALSQGLVDALVEKVEDLIPTAKAWCEANPSVMQPWDRKGFRRPGGGNTRPDNGQMWAVAPAMLNKKTWGNYPAQQHILSCVYEGDNVDFDTALRIESRYFADLAVGRTSKNMLTAFWFQLNQIKKGAGRPQGVARKTFAKVGILGAGMMGSGIAYAAASAGIDVVLKDVSEEAAERGKAYSEKILTKLVSRGRRSQAFKDLVLARIETTTEVEPLQDCDLVVEAVFENRELKAKVTEETEAVLAENAIFASNTSTLPISGLAEHSRRPQNFIGLHFFSPVDKMPLVEIIVGKETGPETLAAAYDFVLQIRKTPIVVNDSRGFYTSRVFSTYVLEGLALLVEGQPPRLIETAGLQAGMPVGPLALCDEVGISLLHHILSQTRRDFEQSGQVYVQHPGEAAVFKMVEDLERRGKKDGKGFYEYPEGGKKHLWPGLAEHFPLRETPFAQSEAMDRLMFIQALETTRCLEEKVVTRVADANIGSIFGWGFAPFKGGTIQFINDYGVADFVSRAKALAANFGSRFEPPELLLAMVKDGRSFPSK